MSKADRYAIVITYRHLCLLIVQWGWDYVLCVLLPIATMSSKTKCVYHSSRLRAEESLRKRSGAPVAAVAPSTPLKRPKLVRRRLVIFLSCVVITTPLCIALRQK